MCNYLCSCIAFLKRAFTSEFRFFLKFSEIEMTSLKIQISFALNWQRFFIIYKWYFGKQIQIFFSYIQIFFLSSNLISCEIIVAGLCILVASSWKPEVQGSNLSMGSPVLDINCI